MSLLALARPRCMSTPLCPPLSPLIVRRTPISSASGSWLSWYSRETLTSTPPAQPTKRSPSTSESILRSMSPLLKHGLSPLAPSMPTSSSMVKSASRGPCLSVSSARIAREKATPIPLSAPSVVPSAVIQSPSCIVWIGSVSKLCTLSEFFCGTMSRCPCSVATGRSSSPGVAGLRINTLPTSSTWVSSPSRLPSATTYSRTA